MPPMVSHYHLPAHTKYQSLLSVGVDIPPSSNINILEVSTNELLREVPDHTQSLLGSTHLPESLVTPYINMHPMLTQAKTFHFKPNAYVALTEPTSVKQALSSAQWFQAMQQEYNARLNNKT